MQSALTGQLAGARIRQEDPLAAGWPDDSDGLMIGLLITAQTMAKRCKHGNAESDKIDAEENSGPE